MAALQQVRRKWWVYLEILLCRCKDFNHSFGSDQGIPFYIGECGHLCCTICKKKSNSSLGRNGFNNNSVFKCPVCASNVQMVELYHEVNYSKSQQ